MHFHFPLCFGLSHSQDRISFGEKFTFKHFGLLWVGFHVGTLAFPHFIEESFNNSKGNVAIRDSISFVIIAFVFQIGIPVLVTYTVYILFKCRIEMAPQRLTAMAPASSACSRYPLLFLMPSRHESHLKFILMYSHLLNQRGHSARQSNI